MARIRSIKPDFFTSEAVAQLSLPARLTFVGLWTAADDEGRGPADPRLVKAALWPLDDATTPKRVAELLAELHNSGMVRLYNSNGRTLFQVTNWTEHQRVSHPSPSRFAAPEDSGNIPEGSGSPPELFGSPPETFVPDRKGKERKGKEGRRAARPVPDFLARIAEVHEELRGVGSFRAVQKDFETFWPGLVEAHGPEKCAAVWRFAKTSGTEREQKFRTPRTVAADFTDYDPTALAFPDESAA